MGGDVRYLAVIFATVLFQNGEVNAQSADIVGTDEEITIELLRGPATAIDRASRVTLRPENYVSAWATYQQDGIANVRVGRKVATLSHLTLENSSEIQNGSIWYNRRGVDTRIPDLARTTSGLMLLLSANFGGRVELSTSLLTFEGGERQSSDNFLTLSKVDQSGNPNDNRYFSYSPNYLDGVGRHFYAGFQVYDDRLAGETWPSIWSIDQDGSVRWKMDGGIKERDRLLGLDATDDGVIVVAEVKSEIDDQSQSLWTAKFDQNGALEWDWVRENTSPGTELLSVTATSNGAKLLFTETLPGGNRTTSYVLVSDNGQTIWQAELAETFDRAAGISNDLKALSRRTGENTIAIDVLSIGHEFVGSANIDVPAGYKLIDYQMAGIDWRPLEHNAAFWIAWTMEDENGDRYAIFDRARILRQPRGNSSSSAALVGGWSRTDVTSASLAAAGSARQELMAERNAGRVRRVRADARDEQIRLAQNRELERRREEREARQREASIAGLWADTLSDVRRSVAQSVESTRPRTPQRNMPARANRREAGEENGDSRADARRSGSSQSTRPSSARTRNGAGPSRMIYQHFDYHCEFRGWPNAEVQSERGSMNATVALRPVVVGFSDDHDWEGEHDKATRNARRAIERFVVRSPIRIDGGLESFRCTGGFFRPFDSREVAQEFADTVEDSQGEETDRPIARYLDINPFR